jgi:hypothetical protein
MNKVNLFQTEHALSSIIIFSNQLPTPTISTSNSGNEQNICRSTLIELTKIDKHSLRAGTHQSYPQVKPKSSIQLLKST